MAALKPDRKQDIILDSITDGVFTVDHDWRITSFNRAAEEITGVTRKEAIGQFCKDVLKAEICEKNCVLRETMTTGIPAMNRTVHIVNNRGERIPVSISTALLKDGKGRVMGAVETFRDLSAIEHLRKEIEKRYSFEDILSRNYRMREIFRILPDIAESSSTVLIEGESGTGKELIARAIHNLSQRRSRPFITVHCGALPDTLLESELFGYKAGAFTDAKKDKPGRFMLAHGGSIFLDEIGDISPALQVRLLRVLQDKTFEPLGSVETVKADVRVITATNRNMDKLVREGKFREDLYYRINVIRLEAPPLRERKEDIPLLIDYFIRTFNAVQNKEISGVTDDAMACLMSYDFPGNIRELKNIVERSFVLCKSPMIGLEELPSKTRDIAAPAINPGEGVRTFQDLEASFLFGVLRKNNWNRSRTAQELGIHKSTLFRKIKALGLELPPGRGKSKEGKSSRG